MPSMKKCDQKILFLDFQFFLASSRTTAHAYTTVINNNIDDQEAPGPHQFDFAIHLKCITRVKLRVLS